MEEIGRTDRRRRASRATSAGRRASGGTFYMWKRKPRATPALRGGGPREGALNRHPTVARLRRRRRQRRQQCLRVPLRHIEEGKRSPVAPGRRGTPPRCFFLHYLLSQRFRAPGTTVNASRTSSPPSTPTPGERRMARVQQLVTQNRRPTLTRSRRSFWQLFLQFSLTPLGGVFSVGLRCRSRWQRVPHG